VSNPGALPDLSPELALALALADEADVITMGHFRSVTLRIDRKADASEVTQADIGCERALRSLLNAARPEHAVLGEEDGLQGPDSPWRWVLDPIDGTSNYTRGVPVWATLIALMYEGAPVLGVVSAPAMGRRWWAARGLGAFSDLGAIQVSTVDRLEDAFLASAGAHSWGPRAEAWLALALRVRRERGFGDFWQHMLVAEGNCDAACEPIVNLWDLAAIQIVVEEAGGRFTDLDGQARPDGGSAVSSNGRLHQAVLDALAI
jgi:histidinol-phosphatase